jgi:hypothetical protein
MHLAGRLRFGVFEADLSACGLTKLGKRLSLQEQPFQHRVSKGHRSFGNRAVFDSNLAYAYAYAYAVSGRKAEALKIAKDLEVRPDSNPSANANIALIYVGLGDRGQAMTWLNKAFDARFNPSILRPGFDSLRSDVRFQDLWRRIGLPAE